MAAKVKSEGLEIVDSSAIKVDLGEMEITAKVGENIAKIGGQIAAKGSVIAYKKSDLENLGKDYVASRVPAGNILDAGSLRFESSAAPADAVSGNPMVNLAANALIYQGMAIDDLKKALSEKTGAEANMFLAGQPGAKKAEIRFTPPWRSEVPRELDRIQIEVILD